MPICFPPVVDERTVFMVIGSMPGAASLAAQAYYAHPRNLFWPCVWAAFSPGNQPKNYADKPVPKPYDWAAITPPPNYADKLAVLLANGGGLWDALSSCERAGSLDTHIRQAVPNDFLSLFARYPAIKTLLFNGTAAHQYFVRAFGQLPGKTYLLLPSTSPANAALSPQQKSALWVSALRKAAQGLN